MELLFGSLAGSRRYLILTSPIRYLAGHPALAPVVAEFDRQTQALVLSVSGLGAARLIADWD